MMAGAYCHPRSTEASLSRQQPSGRRLEVTYLQLWPVNVIAPCQCIFIRCSTSYIVRPNFVSRSNYCNSHRPRKPRHSTVLYRSWDHDRRRLNAPSYARAHALAWGILLYLYLGPLWSILVVSSNSPIRTTGSPRALRINSVPHSRNYKAVRFHAFEHLCRETEIVLSSWNPAHRPSSI